MSERNPLAGINPAGIFERLVTLGEAWGDANAAAAMLEEMQKPLLSKLTIQQMEGGVSRALAETEALASDEYGRHVERMVAARREANLCRVRYQSGQVWAELLRSANANRRAELAMSHHTP